MAVPFQGFVTIGSDPYIYQENTNLGIDTSSAMGIESTTGFWGIYVSPNTGASPDASTYQFTIDPATGNFVLNPGIGVVSLTGAVAITSLNAYEIICGGTTNADPLQSVGSTGAAGEILVSAGAGALPVWTAAAAITSAYTAIDNTDSPYTVLSTDYFISCDSTAGAITVRLPNAPATGRSFIIKDRTGQAAANNITVTTVGGVVNIDGAATFVMNTAFESVTVLFNGTSYEIY